jgi:hypothetical protein
MIAPNQESEHPKRIVVIDWLPQAFAVDADHGVGSKDEYPCIIDGVEHVCELRESGRTHECGVVFHDQRAFVCPTRSHLERDPQRL